VGVVILILLAILTVAIVLVVVFTRRYDRRKKLQMLKRRPSNHLLLKPQFAKGETYYNINLCPSDINKTRGDLEFPREKLELEFELGRGKFGQVFRAKAHGMVAALPDVNTVAVKTTLNGETSLLQTAAMYSPLTVGSYAENTRLMNELKILKSLHRQPHRNICNLLGHCFEASEFF